MDSIVYKHRHTVKYDFDTSNITEADHRDVIKRHYDFLHWCEYNTDASYSLNRQYNHNGIAVSFESEQDYHAFRDYIATYHWLIIHN